MKIGKEGIVGAMVAFKAWSASDRCVAGDRKLAAVRYWGGALPGPELDLHRDGTGNPIDRLKVNVVPDKADLYAWERADRLVPGTPSIQVRDDLIEYGCFFPGFPQSRRR